MQNSMPSSAFDGWRSAASLEGQLRRALFRAERGTVVQDRIDCAELALACGQPEAARTLYGLVFLQLGASPQAQAWRAEVGRRTGLWDGAPEPGSGAVPKATFSVDLALAELRELLPFRPSIDIAATPPPPPTQTVVIDPERLRSACRTVEKLLAALPRLQAESGLGLALRILAVDIVSASDVLIEDDLDGSIAELAARLALGDLKRFVLEIFDLLHARTVGGSLFDAASRLHPARLGPYFNNLHLVIRDGRDILGLLRAAGGDDLSWEDQEAWFVLLAERLPEGHLLIFIDELADRGLTRSLRELLAQIGRRASLRRQLDPVWRIRDAALDLHDWALAEEAQALLLSWSPGDVTEWRVLGEIRASYRPAGTLSAATHAPLRDLEKAGTSECLAALAVGAATAAKLKGGYGTPPWRTRLRARCTSGPPSPDGAVPEIVIPPPR